MAFLQSFVSQQLLLLFSKHLDTMSIRRIVSLVKQIFGLRLYWKILIKTVTIFALSSFLWWTRNWEIGGNSTLDFRFIIWLAGKLTNVWPKKISRMIWKNQLEHLENWSIFLRLRNDLNWNLELMLLFLSQKIQIKKVTFCWEFFLKNNVFSKVWSRRFE